MTIEKKFWQDKKVFLTGHTGFKGSWLSLWLNQLGAKCVGYSLDPPSNPSLFQTAKVHQVIQGLHADILDYSNLVNVMAKQQPDIIIHLAAQSLVAKAFQSPLDTIATNIMGTANLLEAAKNINSVKVILVVTSDKCYAPHANTAYYQESDSLGGNEPYSVSKASAEHIVGAYKHCYFDDLKVQIVTARSGNVIGGGDWGQNRLVTDVITAINEQKEVVIRNPAAVRPWQYVLDPLSGYLQLIQYAWDATQKIPIAWNFGPNTRSNMTVEDIVNLLYTQFKLQPNWQLGEQIAKENILLNLNCHLAKQKLNWQPKLSIYQSIEWIVNWYQAYFNHEDMVEVTIEQIESYQTQMKLTSDLQ